LRVQAGDVIGGGPADEGAASGALRCIQEILSGDHPKRLAHRRTTDAELGGPRRLVGQALAGRQLAGDDELAQLIGDLLVRLADTLKWA
jgi:hypothetical protein